MYNVPIDKLKSEFFDNLESYTRLNINELYKSTENKNIDGGKSIKLKCNNLLIGLIYLLI